MLHAVQAYHTAQRLLGGFLSSSEADGGSGNNNDKPPGFFSLKAYRKYFNVDTSVRLMSRNAAGLGPRSPVLFDTSSSAVITYCFSPRHETHACSCRMC